METFSRDTCSGLLSKIGQINLPVQDLQRAVQFYRHQLGIKFLYQYPGLAFFDCAGVGLMLSEPEGEVQPCGSVVYFHVDEIHRPTHALKQKGVQFIDEPHLIVRLPDHDLWMAFFRDSEGNQLALMWQNWSPDR